MKKTLTLSAISEPRVSLRAAEERDLDELRSWKNANRAGFFFQGEITPSMQKDWYKKYRARPDDFMFIVEHAGKKMGCMGMRVKDGGAVDVYNIIAAPGGSGKGFLKAAMATMCSYAADRFTKDIGCLVLKDNPATGYYESCGFKIVGDGGDHHIFKLDRTKFKPVAYEISEG